MPPRSRRSEIYTVAELLFRQRGYLATSMRDIADVLKMKGGGSLYAHIKGKEQLLSTIANTATDAFFEAFAEVTAQNLPPLEKLRAAMIRHMLVITENLSAAAVYLDEWRHLSEPERSRYMQRRDRYEFGFQRLIEAGIAAGALTEADPRLTTLHVMGAMNALVRWYRPEGRLSAETIARHLGDMILTGLCTRPPAP